MPSVHCAPATGVAMGIAGTTEYFKAYEERRELNSSRQA
jgi:hypothetical protein